MTLGIVVFLLFAHLHAFMIHDGWTLPYVPPLVTFLHALFACYRATALLKVRVSLAIKYGKGNEAPRRDI